MEKEHGNTFHIDVFVKSDFTEVTASDDISQTVNYETIAAVCKEEMNLPSNTLEHIGFRIITSLFKRLPISKVNLKISKSNPPIEQNCVASVVSMKVRRSDLEKE